DLEGDLSVVITKPEAIGVFERIRDCVPGGDLIGLEQSSVFGFLAPGEAYVDHVWILRSFVASVGLDGFNFFSGTALWIQVVKCFDERIFRLKSCLDFAIVCPVIGESDNREFAFLGGGFDQFVHPAGSFEINRAGGWRWRQRAWRGSAL